MKSIRRRVSAKQRNSFLGFLALIALITISYINYINPLFSHAESQYMVATIVDDNGEVDFSPGIDGAVADFSYVKVSNYLADSNIYDAKITLTNLPTSIDKQLKISLPVGMLWVDDASSDENLLTQVSSIETIAVNQEPVLGYAFPKSGARIYHISDSAVALAVNIKVKADKLVAIGEIEEAIKAELTVGEENEVATVDVNVPTGYPAAGRFASTRSTMYVSAGQSFSANRDYAKTVRASYTAESYYDTERLVKKVVVTFHVSDTNVRIALVDGAASTYTLDSSDQNNGNYTLTWTASGKSSANLALQYTVLVPDDAADGSSFTISATAETAYWQPDGEDLVLPFYNSQNITYVVLPDIDDGVTVGFSNLNPNATDTAKDVSIISPISEGNGMIGILGYTYINNKSANDSPSKTAHVVFDTEAYGVMGFRLACSPNNTIEDIKYKTINGNSGTANVNTSCTQYGMTPLISYANLGTSKDDYISEIEYEIGVIPAGTQLRSAALNDGSIGLAFMGRWLDNTKTGITTVEVYSSDNAEATTGIAKITSSRGTRSNITVGVMANRIVNAGNTMNFALTISPYGTTNMVHLYGTSNPIIYIRQEIKDAAGNYLPISNIKVTNGAARGNEDITSLFGQVTYEDTDTARVYKLDGRNVPDGLASLSTHAINNSGAEAANNIVLSYSVQTDLTTPSQTYNIKDMIFVQDPNATTASSTNGVVGDRFGIGGGTNNIVSAATTNYYQIRGWSSIGVENSGKHTSSDSWLTWSENSNPITIGSAEGSLADMKATMINNSGVDVPGPTTVYLPIPKKDQNWGSLNYNNAAFEFSTALTGAISNPDVAHFTITYGKNVTPSDNGTDLNNEDSKFTANTSNWTSSDWEAVNCIKVTATDIPANQAGIVDNYDFIYRLKVIDSANASDGAVDTWRPLYFQQLTNSAGDIFAGWYKGSYVSVKLANGSISGQIFIDANENGKKDAGEEELKESGWKINLYDKSSNKLVRSTETDANGKYNFIELAMNADGYYIVVTNKHPIDGTGTTYLFTKKSTASNTGTYNTDNQAEGNKTSTPAHATAYVGPISPSNTTGEATYNIGVVEYVATETYSGVVTFDDQNNKFNTRPANVTITATASDGSTQTITVTTGNWTKDLPKYNTSGEKLSYSFSTPDTANYTKSDETEDNGYTYNITYTQKTATLTVNHYKKDSTEKLADTETSTIYWGQTYTTAQATVDSNYEYDSISGAASGTVSGDITVAYYYKLKRGTVITHYYIKDTTTKISEDVSEEYNYTETYTTSPIAQVPATYANYELVSAQPENYTGTVKAPTTEVAYYYQKKDAKLSSNISIEAPESVNNKSAKIAYAIEYSADIKDYIGNITITLIDKLPYPIDEDESNVDGGTYDADARTITWTITRAYNTYTDGEEISIAKNIELVYLGASAKDDLLNTVEGNITLEDKDNDAADSAETAIRTPSKIIFRYTDINGNEIIEEVEDEGIVGNTSSHIPPEIPGYTLVADNDIDLTFEEGEKIITYHYEKNSEPVAPKTGDNIAAAVVIGVMATAGAGIVFTRKRR